MNRPVPNYVATDIIWYIIMIIFCEAFHRDPYEILLIIQCVTFRFVFDM